MTLQRSIGLILGIFSLLFCIACRSDSDYEKLQQEIKKYRAQNEQSQPTIEENLHIISEQGEEIQRLRETVKQLEIRWNNHKNPDEVEFAGLVATIDKLKPEAAIKAYKIFAEKFPLSPLVPRALAAADAISTALEMQQEQEKQQIEEKRREVQQLRTELSLKLVSGKATLEDLKVFLIGFTKDQIIPMFGKPDENGKNEKWEYWHYSKSRVIYDSLSETNKGMTLRFQKDRVIDVDVIP